LIAGDETAVAADRHDGAVAAAEERAVGHRDLDVVIAGREAGGVVVVRTTIEINVVLPEVTVGVDPGTTRIGRIDRAAQCKRLDRARCGDQAGEQQSGESHVKPLFQWMPSR
jgi:hypothetical protein